MVATYKNFNGILPYNILYNYRFHNKIWLEALPYEEGAHKYTPTLQLREMLIWLAIIIGAENVYLKKTDILVGSKGSIKYLNGDDLPPHIDIKCISPDEANKKADQKANDSDAIKLYVNRNATQYP
ncbi:MAG: hypothetical protein ACOX3T_07585 [Bdellovibrionota bacterium]